MPTNDGISPGDKFCSWTVIERVHAKAFKCRCECGFVSVIPPTNLTRGKSRSCGCLQRRLHKDALFQKRKTLVESLGQEVDQRLEELLQQPANGHPLYLIWKDMRRRCNSKSRQFYEHYGGRGIKVCERWEKSFHLFAFDVGDRPDNAQIDRIDNDGDYCPENVRWASALQNARNTRKVRKVEFNGKTQCVSEWAEEIGVSPKTLQMRLAKGWSIERALTAPTRKMDNSWRRGILSHAIPLPHCQNSDR